MEEKKERNNQIYNDRMAGMSWRKLVQKYNLSVTRLRGIVTSKMLKSASKNQYLMGGGEK